MQRVDISRERFEHIQGKIREAQNTGNKRQLKLWRTKENQWQQAYGAYAPIGWRVIEA